MRRSAWRVSIKRRTKCVDLAALEVLDNRSATDVEAVIAALHHIQFTGHASLLQASGVLDVFVVTGRRSGFYIALCITTNFSTNYFRCFRIG